MLMSKPTEGHRGSFNLVVVVIELIGVCALGALFFGAALIV